MQSANKLLRLIFAVQIIHESLYKLKKYLVLGSEIGLQFAYQDYMAVIRKLWFFFIFQIFTMLAFFILPQGEDILQCAIEDLNEGKYLPILFVLIGIWFWSLSSEFGARMLIYLNNVENNSIDKNRQNFRIATQKLVPIIQAIFPFLLFVIAFLASFIHHFQYVDKTFYRFLVLVLVLLLNLKLGLRFHLSSSGYFYEKYFKFYDAPSNSLKSILTSDSTNKTQVSFKSNYKELFKRYIAFFLISCVIFFVVSVILHESSYYAMGTASILILGIACWLVFFYSIKIFELLHLFPEKYKWLNLPYSTLLFIVLLFSSYSNDDHPININSKEIDTTRPLYNTTEYLSKWISYHPSTSFTLDTTTYCNSCKSNNRSHAIIDSACFTKKYVKKIPLIFIGAEGGAFRTGCFTSLLLGAIQDTFPKFRDKIFAYSTVSGGTFGGSLFNSTAYLEKSDLKNTKLLDLYSNYYNSTDFLAPLAAKLMFGEFIGYFFPSYCKKFDRQVALENAWEKSWDTELANPDKNLFCTNFYTATDVSGLRPAVFVNTTVVETGQRGIISNVILDDSFKNVYDLNKKIKNNFSYATAIGLSSRFPLVSPAGKLDDGKHKVHIVDGGYYDNYGNTTFIELLNSLNSFSKATSDNDTVIQIIPMMLQVVFDAEKIKKNEGISFLNEFQEIITGIYKTRSGHTQYANIQLKELIHKMNGCYLEIKVASSNEEVPQNWVLSKYAVDNARRRIVKDILGNTKLGSEGDSLHKFLKRAGVI